MELQTNIKQINVTGTVFHDYSEQPVDTDFVLPDYLPDIAAVLKCIMKPTVQSHQISGDRITAEGTVTLQLLYLDEDRRCVRSFETSQPFSASFTSKEVGDGTYVQLNAKTNYVNCRATGPRRVEIHGAFSVSVTIHGERCHTLIDAVDCANLYTKKRTLCYSKQVGVAEKQFTVAEVVELENGSGAEILLRTEAAPRITDCKIMAGKAIVKGEILLKSVYVTNSVSGEMGFSENAILFSQIIDVDGLDEGCMSSCQAKILYSESHPAQNSGGENKLLSFSAKLLVALCAYRTESSDCLTDAYHTQFPIKTVSGALQARCIEEITCEEATVAVSLPIPDGDAVSIGDLWCDLASVTTRCEKDHAAADLQLSVCMISRDSRECLSYYERSAETVLKFPEVCNEMEIDVQMLKVEHSIVGNSVEVRLLLCLQRKCIHIEEHMVLCELSADEKAVYATEEVLSDCCVKIYFASAGESVWEIAKKQHVSIEEVCAENGIDDGILAEDKMLLFSMK